MFPNFLCYCCSDAAPFGAPGLSSPARSEPGHNARASPTHTRTDPGSPLKTGGSDSGESGTCMNTFTELAHTAIVPQILHLLHLIL